MGRFEIHTEIEIQASSDRVWSILADFPAYPQWNPFVRRIEGELRPGARLTVSIQPEGGKGMTFRPTLLGATPGEELRWKGRVLLPGLFDGEHFFHISQLGPDRCLFVHGEKFSGLLVPLFRSSLNSETRSGFHAMNQALKNRAERQP